MAMYSSTFFSEKGHISRGATQGPPGRLVHTPPYVGWGIPSPLTMVSKRSKTLGDWIPKTAIFDPIGVSPFTGNAGTFLYIPDSRRIEQATVFLTPC